MSTVIMGVPKSKDNLFVRVDTCIHFAVEGQNDNSIADSLPFLCTNVQGTYELLEDTLKCDVRIHHISVDEAYGNLMLDDPDAFSNTLHSIPCLRICLPRYRLTCLCARHRIYGVKVTISRNSFHVRLQISYVVFVQSSMVIG